MGINLPPDINLEQALAGAIALMLERSGSGMGSAEQPPPGWIGDLLGALAPLRALGPTHGKLHEQDAKRLADIQNALSRADLSKAARTGERSELFFAVRVVSKGRKK